MSYEAEIAQILVTLLSGPMGIDANELKDMESWIETPKNKENGDFAFPCFRLARLLKKKPPIIAEEVGQLFQEALIGNTSIAEVRIIGPYLNFVVNKASLAAELVPGILSGDYLARRSEKGERVMVEYSQPNTHKAFHVGHTRNVALGDALWRIFYWMGYDTVPVNYLGDEGTHIAKCLWFYRNHFKGTAPATHRGEFLGELYARAVEMLDFALLTRCPMLDVVTARVLSKDEVAEHPTLKRVKVAVGEETYQVVCGGSGYQPGDIVAYAQVGARVNGRRVEVVEKAGVLSTGMILSEKELGFTEDNQQLYLFPPDTGTGLEVTEFFRVEGALPEGTSVAAEMRVRQNGVSETLKAIEARDPEMIALWQETRQWSLDDFKEIYEWLGARFDHDFFESEVGDSGKKLVMEHFEKGELIQSEGAIGSDLSEYKLPFCLLLKSDGTSLYSTKDIALAHQKFEKFKIDRSIYVVDVSQSLHFQQVFKTLELMGYTKASRCYHLPYGMVVLPEGKMSSRKGNVILFNELRELLDKQVRENFLNNFKGEWPEEEIDMAAHRVSVATIRYGMNNQDNQKNIVFDLQEWASATGNTGPYMLYAYARTRSILRKAGQYDTNLADWSLLTHEKEEDLLNRMSKFHETVERACRDYRPQWLCLYLYDLSRDFSRFFDNCPVLKAESENLKVTRLMLVDAAGQMIRKGLNLLGIETLERM